MDYIKRLKDEVKRGFSKTYLEEKIGLTKNTLASYLTGVKKMTPKNADLIIKFLTTNPNLDLADMPKRTRIVKMPNKPSGKGLNKDAEKKPNDEDNGIASEKHSNPKVNAIRGQRLSKSWTQRLQDNVDKQNKEKEQPQMPKGLSASEAIQWKIDNLK